ncbi:hypothetical protein ACFL5D_04400 [Candidatus Neomarinimicrobiota bacterium]
MSNCIYCGKPAGLLKKQHKECFVKNVNGKQEIISIITDAVTNKQLLKSIKSQIDAIAKNSFISDLTKNDLILEGWEGSVEKAFEDGILTEQEGERLTDIVEYFKISEEELDCNGMWGKIVKGVVLRELLEGIIPERIKLDGEIPFNLQKSEKIIWAFNDVEYYEDKTKRHYEGGHHGVSMRVMKGFYYRTGTFKGYPVETTETQHLDTGFMGITNKHIYFSGNRKSFRVNYNKIVTFQPFEDGIGIHRDALTAKPQTFKTGDGWFTYNLITNIAKMGI